MKVQKVLITRSETGFELSVYIEKDGEFSTVEKSYPIKPERFEGIDAIVEVLIDGSLMSDKLERTKRLYLKLMPRGALKSVTRKLAEFYGDVRMFRDDEVAWAAAQIAHQVNREYRMAIGEDAGPTWDDAPVWQREIVVAGAMEIVEDPMTSPEQSHGSWLKRKVEAGWVYGETKDVEKKTHPCVVPYEELSFEQRTKDRLFGATIRAALDAFDELLDDDDGGDDEDEGDDDGDLSGLVRMPDGSPVPSWPEIFASHIESMDAEERAQMKAAWRGLGEKLFVVS